MKMNIIYGLFALMLLNAVVVGQGADALLEDGKKLEMRFKEEEAIGKYQQAYVADPHNKMAIMKLSELSGNIGARQADPVAKEKWYREAMSYAMALKATDSTSADTYYTLALAFGHISEVEEKRDSLFSDVKEIKRNAETAIGIDPNYGKAWNLLGRWHLEMVSLNVVKKSALKVLYSKFPEANIDSSIAYLEKCKTLEPYYCQNFLDLGKAYHFKKRYEKAIAVLEQLAKLPTRRQDDPAIKKEGAALWQNLQ